MTSDKARMMGLLFRVIGRKSNTYGLALFTLSADANVLVQVETRDPKTGELVRVNADDDEITLGEMLRQERFSAGPADQKNLDMEFAKAITTDGGFQADLDYMDDNAERLGRKKMRSDAMKRQFAINGPCSECPSRVDCLHSSLRLQENSASAGDMSVLLWRRRLVTKSACHCDGHPRLPVVHIERGARRGSLSHRADTAPLGHA